MAIRKNIKDQAEVVLLEVPADSELPGKLEKISEQTGLSPLDLFRKWVLQEESLIGVLQSGALQSGALQSSEDRLSDEDEACDAFCPKTARENGAKADFPAPGSPEYRKLLVNRVMKLKNEGMTLTRIAATFNEEKVPTVSGAGKWYSSSITNLLNAKIQE
ncbi:MAG: recombinase family protein [Synergistaceae bacterium]|jgi:hypothetical protein|nr:recombinase family protein [Synergistaceae bacterium]